MTPSVVYQNDFQGAVGSEWSSTATSLTPVGNRQFLGEFGNESVSLALADLPTHNSVTVSFDLFVIRSWDGNNTESNATHGSLGADVWNLTVADGPTLLHTTFSNHNPDPHAPSSRQAYPDAFAGGDYPAYSGAAEVNTLGYLHPTQPIPMDAVYHLTFTFDHVDAALQLNFSAFGLQGLTDESWGLDNVQVAVETLPPPPNVTAILTGDNHYGLYTGSADGNSLTFIGRNETGAAVDPGTYNWSLPETYEFHAAGDDHLYVLVWDDGGPQSWIGQFILPDGSTLYSDATNWEYALGGANPGTTGAVPPLSQVMADIAGAAWSPVGVSADNGTSPWGHIPGLSAQADFIWHDTFGSTSSSDGHYVLFRTRETVNPTQHPPVAAADAVEARLNTPEIIAVATLLANDFDPDGDSLRIVGVGVPDFPHELRGTVSLHDNGTPTDFADDFITYTPPANSAGIDVFQYTLRDGTGREATGRVTVTIGTPVDAVTGVLTADNHYGLYIGTADGSTLTFIGRNEVGAAGNPGAQNWSLPEAYTFSVPLDNHIYVVVWDDGGPQSWIGEFALPGGKTLYSDPTAWEYTIGSGANPGVNGPVPPLSLVQSDIANGVWLPVGASAPNGSAPWGTIPDIASQANFLWHDTLDENSSSDGHFVIFRAKDAPKFIADLDVNGNKSLADKVDGAANYLPGYEGTTPKVSSGTTFNTSAYTGQKMKIVVEGAGTNAGITEVEFRIIEVSSYSGYAENASDPKITGANKEKDYSFAELADNDTFTLTLATAAGGQIEADRAWVDFWCKDYGGFADILITIKAGNQVLDSIRLDVPRDIDSDRLADRWELEKITEWENQYNVRRQSNLPILQFYSNNLSADDELRDPDGARGQNDPAGTRALPEHKTTGDALTMLEEYRGFILDGGGHDGDGANPIASGHNRLSPAIKELLVEVDAMVFAQGNTPGIVNRPPGGFSSALNKASQGFSDKNTGAGIRMYWVNSETSLAHQTFLSTLELFNFRAAHRDPLLKANFVHLLFWDTVGFASEGVTYEDAQTTPLHQTTDKKTGNGSLILIDQIHAAAARTKLGYTFETSMFTVLAHELTHLLINPQQVVDPITNRQVWNIVREHEIHPDGDGIAGSRIGLLSLMYEPATRQNRTAIWFSNLTRLEIDLVGNLGLDR